MVSQIISVESPQVKLSEHRKIAGDKTTTVKDEEQN